MAVFKIPGNMVVAANNSAVISAACYCIPVENTEWRADGVESQERLLELAETGDTKDSDQARQYRALYKMSTRKLKWGCVSSTSCTEDDPGHLAFGSEDQEIRPPVRGAWYSGSKDRRNQF